MTIRHHIVFICVAITIGLASCKAKKGAEESASGISAETQLNQQFQITFFEAQKQKAIENYDKAYEKLELCASLKPSEGSIYYELAKLDTLNGDFPKALNRVNSAIDLDKNNLWYYRLKADIEISSGALDDASSTLKSIADKDPDDSIYRKKHAEIAIYKDDYSGAVKLYNEIESISGKSLEISDAKYYALMELGKNEEALAELNSFAQAYPFNSNSSARIANHHLAGGNEDLAISTFEKLVSENPYDGLSQLYLGELYAKNGKSENAKTALEIGFLDEEVSTETKSEILNKLTSYEAAEETLASILPALQSSLPQNGTVWLISGQMEEKKGNSELAFAHFSKALEIDPNQLDLWKKVCEASLESKSYENLRKTSEEALTLFPLNTEFYLFKGIALSNLEKSTQAVSILKNGYDLLLSSQVFMQSKFELALAQAEFNNDNTDLAQNWLFKSQEDGKTTTGPMSEQAGDLYFQMGFKDKALIAWKSARTMGTASDLIDRKIEDEQYISE